MEVYALPEVSKADRKDLAGLKAYEPKVPVEMRVVLRRAGKSEEMKAVDAEVVAPVPAPVAAPAAAVAG